MPEGKPRIEEGRKRRHERIHGSLKDFPKTKGKRKGREEEGLPTMAELEEEEPKRTFMVDAGEVGEGLAEGDHVSLVLKGTVSDVKDDGSLVIDVESVSKEEEKAPTIPTAPPEMLETTEAPMAPPASGRSRIIADIIRRKFRV